MDERRYHCHGLWSIALCLLTLQSFPFTNATAAEPEPAPVRGGIAFPSLESNVPMKTLGGRQFWGDVVFFHDWRIQKNVVFGQYRLLDGKDRRHASGTLAECRAALERIKVERKLPKMSGKAVVLVHGIVRSSKSLAAIGERLKEEGYQVFGFDYPSTRVSIEEAAEFLHSALASLDGFERIDLVVHSMGGLVVRAYLAEHEDERLHRMVMIAVPNLGAHMADRMENGALRGPFRLILGEAGGQMVRGEMGLSGKLPTPEFEFGVIAGARGTDDGYNPLIPGDDDGTIAVESTKLPGAADFIMVKGLHSFLMNDVDVVDHAARFLETGKFRDKGDAQPIPREKPAEAATSDG
ncbi:MAG: alpha/beta fold hydrolase [Planctomycetales bacterium]